MIVFENKGFQTNSLFPDSDWTGKAKFVLPDNSETATKIARYYPYYDFVLNDAGELVDVVETSRPEPTRQTDTAADIMSMMVDHEYRLTLMELGVTE